MTRPYDRQARLTFSDVNINPSENEDKLLNKVLAEKLLDQLSPKERDTIVLWAYDQYTTSRIAEIISEKYEVPRGKSPITQRTICIRIQKILKKMRKLVENRDLSV